ncbi:MAG: exosortase [Methylomonas sp.]|nr:MAG: exosortase [Methylomonas sp.]PPD26765.1 MAG: exosortase [Methylomonas sp.]PPD38600.1 MAG: exosortase [Methylomonas sp.]PPD42781.1 MAG: exosortase [Methylomonas sp.]PPD55956.1 MAG: exosortase [Methylomonas sp.]
MIKTKHLFLVSVLALSVYAPTSHAESYIDGVGHKLARGFGNLFTGLVEIPKNIVNASNKTNPVIGFTGGLVMGTLDTLGRTTSGIVDILSSPIPSKPLAYPEMVWNDFNKNTTYFGCCGK